MKTTNDIINEARERAARIRDMEMLDEMEKKRFRTVSEAVSKINYWKKQHSRKTKTKVSISIVSEYVFDISRNINHLRLFIAGELKEIIPIDDHAFNFLTVNIEAEVLGGKEFYTLYRNIA